MPTLSPRMTSKRIRAMSARGPPGTVKSHVHRAKQELRRMLRPVRPSASADPVRKG